ncbi:MAG: AAA family ATPase [Clostridia bacterium]|nr:AAA family ATPase [Clostridia bacterium]
MSETNDEIEICIPDLLHSIWELRWIVLLLIILGGIVGAILSWDSTPSYEARASMIVNARNINDLYQNGSDVPRNEDIQIARNLVKTVQLLATSNRVLELVLDTDEYRNIPLEELKQDISVTAEDDTAFLWLTLNWENPQQAIYILNRLMDVLPEVMLEVMDIGSVNVIDTARQAQGVSPSSQRNVVIGIAVGLISGCILGIIYYLFMPKIRNSSSLETLGLDIIGEIPFIETDKHTTEEFLVNKNVPEEYQVAYGRLAAVFYYLTEKNKQQIIAVTSSIPGEGKSTVAYNLALRLTELGCKVLLLDFDFKKGMLYQFARKIKPKDGDKRTEPRIGENLRQQVEQMYNGIYTIQGFSQKNIFQIDNQIFPTIQSMKDTYNYILIDTPPIGTLSDVQLMRGLMDSVVLVVRPDWVLRSAVEDSLDSLKKSGIPVTGGIVNGKIPLIVNTLKRNIQSKNS